MRCRSRLWSLSYYEADVNELLTAIRNNEDLSTPSSELERLSELHRICSDSLIQTLRQHYRGEEFEQPLKRVLSQLYSREATVEHVGGRAEEGADFLLTKTDDFGNEIRTVIQVKMWEGESDLREAMEQLEHACNAQRYKPVSSAVILTTLDSLSDGVESHRKELEDRLGVPISVLLANETTNLFFRALPEIVANPER